MDKRAYYLFSRRSSPDKTPLWEISVRLKPGHWRVVAHAWRRWTGRRYRMRFGDVDHGVFPTRRAAIEKVLDLHYGPRED